MNVLFYIFELFAFFSESKRRPACRRCASDHVQSRHRSDKRIQMIDLSHRSHARAVFLDTRPVAQVRASIIAATGIDFRQSLTHTFLPQIDLRDCMSMSGEAP